MSDLDQQIRQELARLVDRTPIVPPLEALLDRESLGRKHRIGPTLLLTGAAVLVAIAFVAAALAVDGGDDQVVAGSSDSVFIGLDGNGDGSSDLTLEPPVLLNLPTVTNIGLPLATTSTRLFAGTAEWLDGPLTITSLASDGTSPPEHHGNGPEGIVTAFEAGDGVVMAVVSRHGLGEPPVVVVSRDDGTTWTEYALPQPPGLSSDEAFATDAAIGNGLLMVSGWQGVWTSTDGADWRYVEVAQSDENLTTVAWDGSQFVAGGGAGIPWRPPWPGVTTIWCSGGPPTAWCGQNPSYL